ncbi:MAG: hypothetical protein J6Z01_14275 [Bacteroidales bacterium]|nr:hypothetical protein [Bacteroidales bacterium]
MKKLILLATAFAAASTFFSCNSGEIERLRAQNDSLRSVATTGGIQIDEYFAAFNQIQDNLKQIKEKEQIITVRTGDGQELTSSQADAINEDILSIYDLLLKNKQTIADLNKKMQKDGVKNKEMAKTIQLLTQQVTEKDNEITDLKDKLAKLNFDVEQLNTQVAQLDSTLQAEQEASAEKSEIISAQDLALNTVYYVIGTKKELMNRNVISREGLFKGLKIGDSFDREYFTKVDMRSIDEIPINTKSIRILSTHPAGSYEEVKSGNNISKIAIKDANAFWERSKFLVIMVE